MVNRKPTNPVIDWGNPITKGLVFDMPLSEGNGSPKDLVYNLTGTLNSGVSWVKTPLGWGLDFDGTSGKLSFTTVGKQNSVDSSTIQVLFKPDTYTSGGNFARLFQKGPNTVGYIELAFDGNSTYLTHQSRYGGTGWPQWIVTAPTLGEYHNVVSTYDGSLNATGMKTWLNFVDPAPVVQTNASGSRDADSTDLTIGNRKLDTARSYDGVVVLARYWDRRLTPEEIKLVTVDPWSIYQKPRRSVFNVSGAVIETINQFRMMMGIGF
jgi:hypothetical protein